MLLNKAKITIIAKIKVKKRRERIINVIIVRKIKKKIFEMGFNL